MKTCLPLILALSSLVHVHRAPAQTLTENLIAEDPATLVEQARQDGDVVRGAILFHQGNINCVKCHRPIAERERIGPDLSRMDPDIADTFIVQSILEPSKKIKEGFETLTVLTSDGQIYHGIVVVEDAQKLVLRDNQDVDRLITIRVQDVEESRPGQVSSMPDRLADELKNRQQFLDLLRYVLNLRERGPSTDSIALSETVSRELSPALSGLVLMQQRNCLACHPLRPGETWASTKAAPKLSWSGNRLNPRYLEEFIAEPQTVKPGTTMPQMLGNFPAASRDESARALAHFLVSKTGNRFQPQPTQPEAVQRGFELFHRVGCVACHAARNETAVEMTLDDSIPLGDLSHKYDISGLVEFLEDPLMVRPSGHMPNMQLTHREAIDVANYLLQSNGGQAIEHWELDEQLANQGKLLFSQLDCARCHVDLVQKENSTSVNPLPLGKLDPQRGCLSEATGDWPNFHLSHIERESIRQALESSPWELTSEQQIRLTLKSLNCIACHRRGDFGGVTAQRNPHFQSTNLNLGEQGRIPPNLTGVGAKLKPDWMRDVLVNHRTIRPYMKTRMPQFGEENVGHLVRLFQSTDRLSETRFAQFHDQKEMRKTGLQLAGDKGLNCVACHTYKYKISDTMPAVDLTEMTERLKKDWFYQYMLAPQKFSPNTVMPSFWPGGVAIRQDLPGSPQEQIEALWQYLIDGRQAAMPSGVVREPLEIVVTNEAQMLRRSYPGIGKRGIGVGYPGGVNLAFDAEQMRLATIWKGKFADPSGVWRGQGSGNVRAMGKPIQLAKGPELDDLEGPWIVDDGRPPNHRFQGYSLDSFQRPTFRYAFADIRVEDFFSETQVQGTEQFDLRRTITVSAGRKPAKLRFRLGQAEEISQLENRLFLVGGQYRIRVISDDDAEIVNRSDGQLLWIPLDLGEGQTHKFVLEYSW